MHDRHSGHGVEVPPVYVEVPEEIGAGAQVDSVAVTAEAAELAVATLNLYQQPLQGNFKDLVSSRDVWFLQEVTPSTLASLLKLAKNHDFEVISPAQRGYTPLEGFDVCMLLRKSAVVKLRVGIVPLSEARIRNMLHVQVQVRKNGTYLGLATAHCTNGRDNTAERSVEICRILDTLQSLTVDGCIFAGDTNMYATEGLPENHRWKWDDAWEVDGAALDVSGTWCPDGMDPSSLQVQAWRFDRLFFLSRQMVRNQDSGVASSGGGQLKSVHVQTVKFVPGSLERQWGICLSDHACVSGSLIELLSGSITDKLPAAEYLKVVRCGLGGTVAKRPAESESCAQKTHSLAFCSKDYEKARMKPGAGIILEDARRKGLYRLYTRRNCHHVNTHDPLKAMGLVANVDDQVVLTIQAAINYLTKYMGKLGTGHTATSRIGGLLDDILCKMQDHETMTVTSLLSKLFIHTAVPDQICSLEAWHVLFDLPRVLSSRFVVNLNAKEQPTFKDLDTIQRGTEHDTVTKQTKLTTYARRLQNTSFGGSLQRADVSKMSLAQFVGRVDCRGRKMSWRTKAAIVKEKPYLNLDARRVNAGDMARYALRLHRRFDGVAQDPGNLSDKEAVEQLQTFVDSKQCPLWLRKRYTKQNKEIQKSKKRSFPHGPTASEDVVLLPVPHEGNASGDVVLLPVPHEQRGGGDAVLLPVPENPSDEPPLPPPECPPPMDLSKPTVLNRTVLEDTGDNRKKVAEEHGFPWQTTLGESRWSVSEACFRQRPVPKRLQMKKYLDALFGEEKPRSATVVDLMQQFVFQMLAYDLAPYARRGGGLVKAGLQKSALVQLLTVHFEFLGSEKPPMKKQRDLKKLPYPALWEEVKARTLAECGLTVGQRSQDKILWTAAGNKTGLAKDGEWRSRVFCLDPWQQADEVVEDPREKLAKRTRYVAGAAQEQSMGLPGNVLHEVALPVDVDALTCQLDKETCSEWDALNPFLKFLNNGALSDRFAADLVDEVPAWTARGSAGMSYSESLRLVRDASLLTVPVAVPDVDPTQQSFVDHLTAFAEAFLAVPDCNQNNLPLPFSTGPVDAWKLRDPALLLGTAGTGKTTTMQAANRLLDTKGLGDRIVRAAYTGVAASNMGSGGRTIVSLFRPRAQFGSASLPRLSTDDMEAMAAELGGNMAVLELDEASMIAKLVLYQIHDRLTQWRQECYHPFHCRPSQPCRCGYRLPFGGVKVILAGDFGQLPPVAVVAEKTLLHTSGLSSGRDSKEVNVGARLFKNIANVFRLRRIHRQAGASVYKESLLRLRDGAHTKEDVELWKTHDLTSPTRTFTPQERQKFERERVRLFCERKKAGQFNGRRLGEDAEDRGGILRIWSVESSASVEKHACESYGGLRRVLHLSMGAPVMLIISNLRTAWNLVNGLRGQVVGLVWNETVASASSQQGSAAASASPGGVAARNAAEVGGVQAKSVKYIVIDFPSYLGPCMIKGHPTYVCVAMQVGRHERVHALSRGQFPLILSYGMTVHKSQGLTLKEGCVFDMEHDATWQPFRIMCGLAFVGMSRVTDFEHMAFRHVPDYIGV